MSWLSAAIGAAGGLLNTFTGNMFADDAAEEARKWTAQREDTAVRRRKADLQAAGFNPLLSAGGAAASSSPSPVASTRGVDIGPESLLAFQRVKSDISQTRAQEAAIKAQTGKVPYEISNLIEDNAIKKAVKANTEAQTLLNLGKLDLVPSQKAMLASQIKNNVASAALRSGQLSALSDDVQLAAIMSDYYSTSGGKGAAIAKSWGSPYQNPVGNLAGLVGGLFGLPMRFAEHLSNMRSKM